MKAIKLENVGKRFILTHQRDRMIKGFFSSVSGQRLAAEFWALRDINMEVQKGKVVGVIGRNGAGKSTLHKILAGTSSPTSGKVEVRGRVSCLLTLGAGFQEQLSGKENIYLNGSILGMNRDEVNRKYRSIVEFSELDGFLDSPLQTYSQGMKMRLGFSVATSVDFDIILIDETISVGDGGFQRKCFDKMADFTRQGKTMIISLHSLDYIERICDEVYLLEAGRLIASGNPVEVVNRYRKLLNENRPLRLHSLEEDF